MFMGLNHEFLNDKYNSNILSNLDLMVHVALNQNFKISPQHYLAMADWLFHLAISPGTQLNLMQNGLDKFMQLIQDHMIFLKTDNTSKELLLKYKDKRFNSLEWESWPFNLYKAVFLLTENFLKDTLEQVPGVNEHNKVINKFILQQYLNMISPLNGIMTNPQIFLETQKQAGANLINGFKNFVEDFNRKLTGTPPIGSEDFIVGKNLAITPGKVIYRNKLIELIQYEPITTKVYPEPILIVPACIMKYYILDLSPHNSLVKYLVSSGHTVFMISWKNPTEEDRELGFDDYLNFGILTAIDIVSRIFPSYAIHAGGYCLGGTMLAIAAAYLAEKKEHRLKTVTLLAAQVDFKEPGELQVFIDQSQIHMLQEVMKQQGYLDGQYMADSFNALHSNELIWGKMIQDYLLGERRKIFDVMAWNTDLTRLPYKMHSEYLEKLFYNNNLTNGNFIVNGEIVLLSNLKMPIFAVGTLADHVAPWRSVYKIHFFTNTDITFVLTTGGHNVGIVSEPGHAGRSYQILTKKSADPCINQDKWLNQAPTKEGSWWLDWQQWLAQKSKEKIVASKVGTVINYPALNDAPGTYVLKK